MACHIIQYSNILVVFQMDYIYIIYNDDRHCSYYLRRIGVKRFSVPRKGNIQSWPASHVYYVLQDLNKSLHV